MNVFKETSMTYLLLRFKMNHVAITTHTTINTNTDTMITTILEVLNPMVFFSKSKFCHLKHLIKMNCFTELYV